LPEPPYIQRVSFLEVTHFGLVGGLPKAADKLELAIKNSG